MKQFLILILLAGLMTLTACSGKMVDNSTDSGSTMSGDLSASGTLTNGCPEGQILADNVCVPFTGTGKNTDLFSNTFDDKIQITEVSSGTLKGYYVEPIGSGSYPGIVMIHEWWGLNDHIKYMAGLLASSGYKVFAIDLYGEVATTPERARELSTTVRGNADGAIEKMNLAIDYLKNTEGAAKIGTLGWCFGGEQSLNISMATPVDATVIYYGNLSEDKEKLKNLKGPVLGIFGDKDTSIPVEKITLFQQNLNELGKQQGIYTYPGLGHAFANPSGANYAPDQTMDAWMHTYSFLESVLK